MSCHDCKFGNIVIIVNSVQSVMIVNLSIYFMIDHSPFLSLKIVFVSDVNDVIFSFFKIVFFVKIVFLSFLFVY